MAPLNTELVYHARVTGEGVKQAEAAHVQAVEAYKQARTVLPAPASSGRARL